MADFDDVKKELGKLIKDYPDFPKKGIQFHDVLPVFNHPNVLDKLCRAIADHYRGKVDAVAGLEARGFLFGPQVSINLNVPFVPVRKKGKLPGLTIQASYKKEYGEDIIEIQKDAVVAGSKILLIDDLLATGGTLKAAFDLFKTAGCVVEDAFVLVELTGLNGRQFLDSTRVHSLITYEF